MGDCLLLEPPFGDLSLSFHDNQKGAVSENNFINDLWFAAIEVWTFDFFTGTFSSTAIF